MERTAESEADHSPRYLRFARALLLGTTVAATAAVASGCGDDTVERADGAVKDASPVPVDGPLPPPDLPKAAA